MINSLDNLIAEIISRYGRGSYTSNLTTNPSTITVNGHGNTVTENLPESLNHPDYDNVWKNIKNALG